MLKMTRILKLFSRSLEDIFLKKIIHFFSQHIMIKGSRLEEDKNIEESIINDVSNLFRSKQQQQQQQQ